MANYLRNLIREYPLLATAASAGATYYAPQFKPAVAALARIYGVCQ